MQLGGPGVGREAASELWDWGRRKDLHEGAGHGRRQAATEAPFFLASYCPGMVNSVVPQATPIKC